MIRKTQPGPRAAQSGGAVKKLFGATLGALAIAAPAQAAVITFDDAFGMVGGTEYWQEAGFDIGFFANVPGGGEGNLVGSFIDGTDRTACVEMACPVGHDSTYYASLNDSYIDITASTTGQRFKIKSFDASFIGANPALGTYPAIAGLLRVQGIRANGTSLIQDFLLNGPSPAGFTFGRYNSPTAFANTEFVEALVFGFVCDTGGSCRAFSTNQGQFGIDNLELVQVPEPGTTLIIGAGLLGLIASARRRKTA
jgi:hypothetical protein